MFTHLHMSGHSGTDPMSRNHINVLSSNVLVALPGGAGTASEVSLALRYGRPVVAYLRARDEIPDLPAEVPVENDLEKDQGVRSREDRLGRATERPLSNNPRGPSSNLAERAARARHRPITRRCSHGPDRDPRPDGCHSHRPRRRRPGRHRRATGASIRPSSPIAVGSACRSRR